MSLVVVYFVLTLTGCGSALGSDLQAIPTFSLESPTNTQLAPTSTPVPATITMLPPSSTPLPPTPTQIQPTATQAPPGDPVLGDEWVRPPDEMVMSFIPAGEFEMGSTESNPCAHLDEFPQHTVYLDGYWIDQTQVTNAQYRRCVDNQVCEAPSSCGWGEETYDEESKADHPVVCVTWGEARTYCEWSGGSLPTEAQWEKAAQGGLDARIPGEKSLMLASVTQVNLGSMRPHRSGYTVRREIVHTGWLTWRATSGSG